MRGILFRSAAVLAAVSVLLSACGGDDLSSGQAASTEMAQPSTTQAAAGDSAQKPDAEPAAPRGTLRMVEFSASNTYDPAAAITAQSAYLYPVYDTLTRQRADFTLEPGLATSWTNEDPNVWEFALRDDVSFHDGTRFNAEAAAANILRNRDYPGNPNSTTWRTVTEAVAIDEYTMRVEFSTPRPQFPLEMSMVMGMMVNPSVFGEDLTRQPAGSGPWIWSPSDSQAGVVEVFTVAPNYWQPSDQGVERIEVLAVSDNAARVNALISGDADIAATLRDADVGPAVGSGMEVVEVANYFAQIVITSRDGHNEEALSDVRVRRAIAHSVDRQAYIDSVHAGRGDSSGGFYNSGFADWHVPSQDQGIQYDPDRARELLTEAGYPNGLTLRMPVMPAISQPMDMIVQMLGSSGIKVELVQINNGELVPRGYSTENREFGLLWGRDLITHPGTDLPKFVESAGRSNPGKLDDNADLAALLDDASATSDPADKRRIYAEVTEAMINRGVVIPLGHAFQSAGFDPRRISGVTMGLNMQAPLPYGIRFLE